MHRRAFGQMGGPHVHNICKCSEIVLCREEERGRHSGWISGF